FLAYQTFHFIIVILEYFQNHIQFLTLAQKVVLHGICIHIFTTTDKLIIDRDTLGLQSIEKSVQYQYFWAFTTNPAIVCVPSGKLNLLTCTELRTFPIKGDSRIYN